MSFMERILVRILNVLPSCSINLLLYCVEKLFTIFESLFISKTISSSSDFIEKFNSLSHKRTFLKCQISSWKVPSRRSYRYPTYNQKNFLMLTVGYHYKCFS